jgi:hypothetical protein
MIDYYPETFYQNANLASGLMHVDSDSVVYGVRQEEFALVKTAWHSLIRRYLTIL